MRNLLTLLMMLIGISITMLIPRTNNKMVIKKANFKIDTITKKSENIYIYRKY